MSFWCSILLHFHKFLGRQQNMCCISVRLAIAASARPSRLMATKCKRARSHDVIAIRLHCSCESQLLIHFILIFMCSESHASWLRVGTAFFSFACFIGLLFSATVSDGGHVFMRSHTVNCGEKNNIMHWVSDWDESALPAVREKRILSRVFAAWLYWPMTN